MGPRVCVVRTGVANLASVVAGLERIGARPWMTAEADEVRGAEFVVLPGVGSFGPAMAELRARGLDEALRGRIRANRATLCVCLGLQLLAQGSEESPGVEGLGVFKGQARRFSARVRVPQLGWNRIRVDNSCRLLGDGCVYFANSFRLTEPPPGWGVARAEHGGPFLAALERGRVLACQFHPELSGTFGLGLLKRWLACQVEDAPC